MSVRFAEGVTVDQGGTLMWYASSENGERGFCNRCGSSLFWRSPGEARDWAINISSLPEDHGQEIFEHIWVDDQPDWYAFADDKPRKTSVECLGQAD